MATVASSTSESTGVSILSQLVRIEASGLSAETARHILKIRFDSSQKARVGELAAKSSAGTLTPDEGAEYDELIAVADRLAVLQSKARQALARSDRPA